MNSPLINRIAIGLGFVFFLACTKTETNIIRIEGPYSGFETYTVPAPPIYSQQEFAARVDSAFYFKNLSDSGSRITYHWDFGDGHTSEEWEPSHRYTARGSYQVTLETRLDGQPGDTSAATLRAYVGQTDFTFGNGIYFAFVDIQELDNGGFVALGYKRLPLNWNDPPEHFIQYLDNYHRETASYTLPGGYYYRGFTRLNNGELLAWVDDGTTYRTSGLFKLSYDGNVRWFKRPEGVEQIHRIQQVADGSLVIFADRLSRNNHGVMSPRTYLIKTDTEASVEWDYHFTGQQDLHNTGNLVEEDDGYIVAGSDVDDNHPTCWSCSSFSLVKISKNGSVLWRNHAPWGATRSGGLAWVYRFNDGGYLVAAKGGQGLYFFSPDGTFQDRRLMPKTAHSVALTASGTIVMQGEEGVNGFHAITYGFSRRGVQLWEKWIDNRPDGSCCASSWTVKTIALRQGGSLTVANRVDRSNNSVNLYYVGVLQELDEKGTYQ